MRLFLALPAAVLCALALALAAGASARTPRFALYDVHSDLAAASHNEFGDVKIWKRPAALAARAHGATLVECSGACTFGAGWLAFARPSALVPADVVSARAQHSKKLGWTVALTLSTRGDARWKTFSRRATVSGAQRGVADALVLVLDGTIVAQPLATQVRHGETALVVPGLSRANALRAAKQLKR